MGDIVDSKGAQYTLPIPLLWQHDSYQPVGEVYEVTVAESGISVKARFAKIDEPGTLKDRLDEAWQSVKAKLVKGLSIGFMPIESAKIKDTWAEHFLKWDWMELSCVTIPANADASILAIKNADQAVLAAIGIKRKTVVSLKSTPGASGKSNVVKQRNDNMNIAEQIAAFEAKRAAAVARMDTIMTEASEKGLTLDEKQSEEYDTLSAELLTIDKHIVRLKAHEKNMVQRATPIIPGAVVDTDTGAAVRAAGTAAAGTQVLAVAAKLPKGMAFTRYVKSLALSKGNLPGALAIAENNEIWKDTSPAVATVLKAAVAAGDTVSDGWASQLVYQQNLVNEFIEFLRPQTIIGKMPNLTPVPFNVRMAGADQGSSAYWVGQGKPVPASKMHTLAVSLGIAKAAGLVILTEELVRSSAPSAELMVRNDLSKAIAQFLDQQFVSPDYAEVTNVSPASITNGVTPTAATGTNSAALRTDVQTLFASWIATNLDPTGGVWIMTPTRALAISLMLNALGQPVFPKMTMNGGEFFGLPVIVSQSALMVGSPTAGEGEMIILANAPEILMADDGQVTIDASREASIQMLDNPTNDASVAGPTPTTLVSMFQTNSVAIKAVRFINWKKRRSNAVVYIKDAAYIS